MSRQSVFEGLVALLLLVLWSACGTEPAQQPATVTNNELKGSLSTETPQVITRLQSAENYWIQRDFFQAKKQYEQVEKEAMGDVFRRYAHQQIARCDSVLQLRAKPVQDSVQALPPPTVAWWKSLDKEWQHILRGQYFKGDAKVEDVQQLYDNQIAINCAGRAVTALDAIAPLANLRAVDLGNTRIESLVPLSNLPKLTTLRCNNTAVSDLSPIARLLTLQELRCAFSPLSDLSALQHLTQLRYLDISGTRVTSLLALSNASLLETVACANIRQLTSAEGLSSSALKRLDMSATGISSLSPLKKCINLKELNINGTPVSSLADLAEHQNLEKLYCKATLISDADLNSFKQTHPKCELVY